MNSNTLYYSVEQTFALLWGRIVLSLPDILTALAVIIIGWIIASSLKALVIAVFARLRVNELLDSAGVDELTKRAGYKLDAGHFVGTVVKWFVLTVAFVVALDVLNLEQVSAFLQTVVLQYLPNVIVAMLILFVAMIVAKVAKEAVAAATQASGMNLPPFLPRLTYVAIIFFAVLAALNQLKIAPELIQILFSGMVFAASLGLGLAFGLGGKDAAGRLIDDSGRSVRG
ncbi:hypothetical protein K2Q16_00630 [Patescibacteria group bacterium]|nr:hypothetical protein [Patescibacteria group bacterium]